MTDEQYEALWKQMLIDHDRLTNMMAGFIVEVFNWLSWLMPQSFESEQDEASKRIDRILAGDD